MKNQWFTLVALAVSTWASAQTTSSFLNKVSLEAGYGYNLGLNPVAPVAASDVSGINSFHAGATYTINEYWGVRGTYMYNHFSVKNTDNQSLTVHKLALEAMFDVTQALDSNFRSVGTTSGFRLYAHAGAGLSMGVSSKENYEKDTMANAQIGIMPVYQFDQNWAVLLDATFTQYFKQNLNFDGLVGKIDGQVATFNLGVKYSF